MATGPVDAEPGESLRAEHDELSRRFAESEKNVQRLTEELAQARRRIGELEARPAAAHHEPLSLFEGGEDNGIKLTGDGSDPRILSIVLGATAVVAGMIALLALFNHTLLSPFGIIMVLLTIGLAWAALRTRVQPTEVSVVRGLVYVKKGETTHRFDVRNASTQVEQVGTPGDPGWEMRFARKGMDPFVINASMVDAVDFVGQLKQWRADI
ncbi:MAG: hypothetical protein FWE71_03675 [Nocardioidaceae bacterium]|nr:hypothetical protein [Nocardioidaceae bacterium]MCL2613512.1 hypothetical protein [Nocardioidaceae bacterium]